MKIAPVFKATINEGKMTLFNKDAFTKYLGTLKGDVNLIIRPYRRMRSTNQNSYLWGVVYPIISDETGMEVEEVHEAMKIKFTKKKYEVKGKELWTVGSTSLLNTLEFGEFLDKVISFAGEFGIEIPPPNTVEI